MTSLHDGLTCKHVSGSQRTHPITLKNTSKSSKENKINNYIAKSIIRNVDCMDGKNVTECDCICNFS